MLGMHGTYRANLAMDECDVLRGHRCALRRPGDGQARRVQPALEARSTSTSTRRPSARPCTSTSPSWETSSNCLQKLLKLLEERGPHERFHEAHCARGGTQIEAWDRGSADRLHPAPGRADPAPVRARQALPDDERHCGDHYRRGPAPDVGRPVLPLPGPEQLGDARAASAPWASDCLRRSGAQAARPGELVLCIAGDGSLHDDDPGAGDGGGGEPPDQDRA